MHARTGQQPSFFVAPSSHSGSVRRMLQSLPGRSMTPARPIRQCVWTGLRPCPATTPSRCLHDVPTPLGRASATRAACDARVGHQIAICAKSQATGKQQSGRLSSYRSAAARSRSHNWVIVRDATYAVPAWPTAQLAITSRAPSRMPVSASRSHCAMSRGDSGRE